MPIYEYKCLECDKKFSLLQDFDAETTTECIDCNNECKRVISFSNVHYKGDGFYNTDKNA